MTLDMPRELPPAGVQLDLLVAQFVMGWNLDPTDDDPQWVFAHEVGTGHLDPAIRTEVIRGAKGDTCGCWMPSTDVAAAWEVAARLEMAIVPFGGGWFAASKTGGIILRTGPIDGRGASLTCAERMEGAYADTMPLAVCHAALLAIAVEDK